MRGVLLEHDSVHPHIAQTILNHGFDIILLPLYSITLTSDYQLFGHLKEVLGGFRNISEDKVQEVVQMWL